MSRASFFRKFRLINSFLLLQTSVTAFIIRPYHTYVPALSSSLPSSALTRAAHHALIQDVEESLSTNLQQYGLLDVILQSSIFWSSLIMLSIVALLYIWEETVKNAREKLPSTLMPVVDSMLAEMGGLGFIGLFLGVVVTGGPFGPIIGDVSEQFLGDEEILLETFEFLHTAFFEVGIAFFTIAGLTVLKVLSKVDSLSSVSRVIFDTNADGEICLEELADALEVEAVVVDLDGDGELSKEEIKLALKAAPKASFWDEAIMTTQQVKAEALVVRERFIQTCKVSPLFRIEDYFSKIFGHNLEEIVELSPLTWLPLVPSISLGRSVDMSRDVVSAASPNAAESCGYFLGSPDFFILSTLIWALTWGWCIWNFWKLTAIKTMLVPTLVRDPSRSGVAVLLPPRYEDPDLLRDFLSVSSPPFVAWVESLWAKPARNDQEKLFGVVGAAGPRVYRDSIKLHAWLVVAQIVFWGGQIVARDINALYEGLTVGNPDLVVPELIIFGFYVASGLAQLWLAPQTFLNYCLVTSIEELAQEKCIQEACTIYTSNGKK